MLLVAGTLVGASGTFLTMLMAKAMGRSVANILFGALKGGSTLGAGEASDRPVRSAGPEDVAIMLGYADRVIIVPGYGLAVAQAQHTLRELVDVLSERGTEVDYAIHPVAGRMPGHMNVLLAEAQVPYEQLNEMDEINGEFKDADVVLVVGANDVVNPAAKTTPGRPDLRHADPQRRPGQAGRLHEALDAPRLRRHRERAALRPEDHAAVRRRQGLAGQAALGGQGALAAGFARGGRVLKWLLGQPPEHTTGRPWGRPRPCRLAHDLAWGTAWRGSPTRSRLLGAWQPRDDGRPAHMRHQIELGALGQPSRERPRTTTGPLCGSRHWCGVRSFTPAPRAPCSAGSTAARQLGLSGWDREAVTLVLHRARRFDPLGGVRFFRRGAISAAVPRGTLDPDVRRLEPALRCTAGYWPRRRTAHGAMRREHPTGLSTAERYREWLLARTRCRQAAAWTGRCSPTSTADCDRPCPSSTSSVACRGGRSAASHAGRSRAPIATVGRQGGVATTDCEWDLPDGRVLVLEIDGGFHREATSHARSQPRTCDRRARRASELTTKDRIVVRVRGGGTALRPSGPDGRPGRRWAPEGVSA